MKMPREDIVRLWKYMDEEAFGIFKEDNVTAHTLGMITTRSFADQYATYLKERKDD